MDRRRPVQDDIGFDGWQSCRIGGCDIDQETLRTRGDGVIKCHSV